MAITIDGTGSISGLSATGISAQPVFAGNILQVVSATYSTNASNSTTTYADTGLNASITPTSASSKVLVLVSQNGLYKSSANVNNGILLKLLRGSTDLIQFSYALGFTGTALGLIPGNGVCSYLDSPATTSAVTYKTQFANNAASAAVEVQNGNQPSMITLLEVAA